MVSFVRKHWHSLVLLYLILTYVIIFSILSILRHNAFASGLDLGNMDQTVWNTLNGSFFSLTNDGMNVSRLAVHADFLLILFAPLYALWSDPKLLLIAQSIYLGLGAVPVFLIAQHLLKNRVMALGFVLIYFLNPLIEWVNIFDFHMVSLVVPAFLSAFYCVLTKRWRWYWLFIALMLLSKEEMGLQVFLLGSVIATVFKNRKIGITTSVLGAAWFFLTVFYLMPIFSSGGEHWAFAWYQAEGVNGIISRVFAPEVLTYYSLLLKSFGFLPVLGLPWLVIAGPELMINILSSHSQMQSIQYHYTSALIPILIIASIYGLKYFKKLRFILLGVALLIVLRVNYHYSPLPTTEACWCDVYVVSENDKKFEETLQAIPKSASVTSSTEIHAHVSQRKYSYLLPHATQSADFIALIDQNRVVDNYGPKPYEIELIKKLNSEEKYELINNVGNFYLYKKR